jgi:hypothetical protein
MERRKLPAATFLIFHRWTQGREPTKRESHRNGSLEIHNKQDSKSALRRVQ